MIIINVDTAIAPPWAPLAGAGIPAFSAHGEGSGLSLLAWSDFL